MTSRFTLIFSLILLVFIAIVAFFTRPIECTDPAGCIWVGPEEPVILGISGITTGQDRSLSMEIQHSLDLFAKNFHAAETHHPLKIQTYFSACLPNVPVQSVIDLSSDQKILAVIGPICSQDGADFTQRLTAAHKVTISPIPYRSRPTFGGIAVYPDIEQLAEQSARWVKKLGYTRIYIAHDLDAQSTAFSKDFCDIFNEIGTCTDLGLDSMDRQADQFDAYIQVFMDEANPPTPDSTQFNPLLPNIMVSFSRPTIDRDQTPLFYWIGPQSWNENNEFTMAYYAEYSHYPSSLASWLLYERLPKIYSSIIKTANPGWDGSWVIPISQLNQQLESDFASDSIFCLAGNMNCSQIPFVLYRVAGNEYKLINP